MKHYSCPGVTVATEWHCARRASTALARHRCTKLQDGVQLLMDSQLAVGQSGMEPTSYNRGSWSMDETDDPIAMRRLVQRLLISPGELVPVGRMPMREPTLQVGGLPKALRVALPIPTGSHVLGSLIQGQHEVRVVLDLPLPREGVFDFYRDRLGALGWRELAAGPPAGFVPTRADQPLSLCAGAAGPEVSISARAQPAGPIHVDLLLRASAGNCALGRPFGIWDVPRLVAPAGAHQVIESGRGDNGLRTRARLTTTSGLLAVLEHYDRQLQRAGWHRNDGGQQRLVAWSVWTAHDPNSLPHRGLLIVRRHPLEDDEYGLDLCVDRQAEAEGEPHLFSRGDARAAETLAATPTAMQDLTRLARRLLAISYGYPSAYDDLQLVAGKLPVGMPVGLPPPMRGRVVGGLSFDARSVGEYDIDIDPEVVVDLLRQAAGYAGWTELQRQNSDNPLGGFVRVHRGNELEYQEPTKDLLLTLQIRPAVDGGTELRLDTKAGGTPPNLQSKQERVHHVPALLPHLLPPPLDSQGGGGGIFGPERVRTAATLRTSRDLAAVAAHYAAQFERAGWTAPARGRDGRMDWSSWTLRGENGQVRSALFSAVQSPVAGEFLLDLEATATTLPK